ncbi:hypothetical protein QFZ77_004353 [Paenibacillus sp. V4I3]|uniref:hypothetical protein n=1 Tax=unclassified Paenibacillus TaxID=185978 RepID=UPI00278AA935|nr:MULTISPECIES: hypothetical protein [unclassified Paenibacillus]MDQ0875694.1 hypothetical protein [Paenibacillus sp. V4I3]MDQ0888236.1 hypothetical protein [Paenibacillus sp. V4I9]
MRKLIFVAFLSLFWLSACSSQQKYTSVIEAIKSEGINITQIESPQEAQLNETNPLSYKLDNNEIIRVYDFGSKEKRELGKKRFQEHQQLLSSYAPIVYQTSNYLVLYYSNVNNSKTATPKLSETKYGEKIQKAINSVE